MTAQNDDLVEIQLRVKFPLHFAVFENDQQKLIDELGSSNDDKENSDRINSLDQHGRTPLMLATVLGHLECAEILLEKGADANIQNREMWSLSHEAIPWKNHNFLKKVLTYRDYQRAVHTAKILLDLNKSLKDTADFFVEMNWEFTSWVPFVKNMCPSDTYKIYKSGTNIRIDANLLEVGSKNGSSSSSSQSFIFRFSSETIAEIIFIDHDQRIASVSTMDLQSKPQISDFVPSDDVVAEKFKSPITTTYVDVDNVGFERSTKSSFLSWIGSSEKEEEVEGYTCRVMNASNVEIVTKTMLDHLSQEDREAANNSNNKTLSLVMNLFEKRRVNDSREASSSNNIGGTIDMDDVYGKQKAVDYLSKNADARNIGKGRQEQVKSNSFNATLWLSESFPLKLREQIFPVIDLMAVRNAKFSRLKSFIELQLPSGFPIRIRIPIFHLINAQITFRNVNNSDQENVVADDQLDQQFQLNPSLFQIPEGFERQELTGFLFNKIDEPQAAHTTRDANRYNAVDTEDEYVYLLERFMGDDASPQTSYERQLQHAIEESLSTTTNPDQISDSSAEAVVDPELVRAMEMSKLEEQRVREQMEAEEEELRKAIERSMIEK